MSEDFFPKPGEGPDKETRENGWFKGLFKVEAEDGEKSNTFKFMEKEIQAIKQPLKWFVSLLLH